MYRIIAPDPFKVNPLPTREGDTIELLREPEQSGRSDFLWQLSISTVTGSRSLVQYPDHDYALVPLNNPGAFMYVEDGGDPQPLQPLVPIRLPGKSRIRLEASSGPLFNFKVVTHEVNVSADVRAFVIEPGTHVTEPLKARRFILYCSSGSVTIRTPQVPDFILPAQHLLDWDHEGDASVLPTLEFQAGDTEAQIVAVTFSPRERGGDIYVPRTEDFHPAVRPQASGIELMPPRGYASLPLAYGLVMIMATWRQRSFDMSVSQDSIVKSHEYWRILTALFAHADVMHIAHNLPPFLFFAWLLGGHLGWIFFPALTFFAGLLSNIATIAMDDPETRLLGASGMIYAMIALWLVVFVRFHREPRRPIKVLRAIGFALVLLFPQSYDGHTSYAAHATGFAIGLALGLLCVPFVKPSWHL